MATIDERAVLKPRRDLIWQSQPTGWLVYDPLVRSGYRCGHAERWLFDQFDGRRSLLEIQRSAATLAELPMVAWHEVAALAETLIRRGLVRQIALHGAVNLDNAIPPRSWAQWFSQSVSWRLRGVNPQKFLSWLAPRTDIFFSRVAVRCWLGLMLCVALLVLADFQRLREQAHLWQWMIKPTSGTALFLIFVVTRAIHELGHALVLTRFGGRSPDIGVIFMLGAPCVYCDVTESWRLPHAWQRAAVAAGGMLAESIVATLAGIVWLSTIEGSINTLALQTMIVCSISTWLVNANPLMRFDGYYILSDWCDEPNLRLRADECAMRVVKRLTIGRTQVSSLAMSTWRFAALALFSVAGFVYRLSLSWMMASVIVALYASWHFESIGKWIATALLVCWWGVPAMKLTGQLLRSAKSAWARLRLGLLAAWAILMICIVPIPKREHGQGWVQPARMQGLYAPQNTRLEEISKFSGDRVQPGDEIFQLDDVVSRLRHIELHNQAHRVKSQLASLRAQVMRNEPVDIDLDAAESLIQPSEQQAHHAAETVAKLKVRAEFAGKLISLPAPKLQDIDGHELVMAPQLWLDRDQRGRQVPQGTMLAAVCSRELLAVVPLQDDQLRDVSAGTAVRFYLPGHSHRIWDGRVQSIVRLEQIDPLARLVAASTAHSDVNGLPAPAEPKDRAGYAAVIELPMQDACINSQVRVAFIVPPQTLATRGNDWAHRNLRWLVNMP